MKLKIVISLLIALLLSGCFKEEGQIRITSNVENAIIYIDGDKKGMTGDGYTTIIIEEGDHKVRILKEKDKEWLYEGKQDVFVGANSSVKIKINIYLKATDYRIKKLEREKKAEKKRLLIEKKAKEERFAREKKAEEERFAREKKDEEQRLSREKKAEIERVDREKREAILRGKEYGLSSYPLGTFYDRRTNLMWQDNTVSKIMQKDLSDAKEYCANLTIGEYSDWYLPNYNELLTIVDYHKADAAIKKGFKNVVSYSYWSSSSYISLNSFTWNIYFGNGASLFSYKSEKHYVRCVRSRE